MDRGGSKVIEEFWELEEGSKARILKTQNQQ
jgi:hypothetical protein